MRMFPFAKFVKDARSVPCAEAVAPPAKTSMSRAGIKAAGNNKANKLPDRVRAAGFRERFRLFIILVFQLILIGSVPGPLSAVLVTTCAEAVAPPVKTNMSRAGIKAAGSNKANKLPDRVRAAILREGFKSIMLLFSGFKVRFQCVSRKNCCEPEMGLLMIAPSFPGILTAKAPAGKSVAGYWGPPRWWR